MAQYLKVGWFKAVGVVPGLFIMGVVLCKMDILYWLGAITIGISIAIGTIYGLLGAVGILKNMGIIEIKTINLSLGNKNKKHTNQ